jgi:hypothetical protein
METPAARDPTSTPEAEPESPSPGVASPGSIVPLDEPGPQTIEEIPAWERAQRQRMQDDLQEQMAGRMQDLGLTEDRFETLMGQAFAQRGALELEE